MKSFFQFLNEAQTNAAKQAKEAGLKGDGHGSWLDAKGRIVGRTVEGELFLPVAENPPKKQIRLVLVQQHDNFLPKKVLPQNLHKADKAAAPEEEEGEDVEKTRGTITIGFGRFNPPTMGHEKLLDKIKDTAEDGEYIIYPSHTTDPQKNPLDSETKVLFMKKMFPDHANCYRI